MFYTNALERIIQTDDFAKAVQFYETTLGLTITHRSPCLIGLETGAFCLYVESGGLSGPVFDFLVPDLEVAKSRLLAAGCTVVEENPSVPRCYIRDPYGLVFNIEQNTD